MRIVVHLDEIKVKQGTSIAYTVKQFHESINRKDEVINTPLPMGLSQKWHSYGYEIFVVIHEDGQLLNLTDALKHGTWRTKRKLRKGHNFEKLVMSGEFEEINSNWLKEN